jgi:hypothetical protein
MLLSDSGEYPWNMRIWNSRQIRRKWYDCPGAILKIMRPYKWLQMLANVLQMPLRILQMLANAFSNACERLTNETTTQRMRGELHINTFQCFTLSLFSQPPPDPLRMLRMLMNALANACECSCESCERLRLLTNMLQKQWEYDTRQEFRNIFLNYVLFATPLKWQRMLTNTYECLAITLRSLRVGGELHS